MLLEWGNLGRLLHPDVFFVRALCCSVLQLVPKALGGSSRTWWISQARLVLTFLVPCPIASSLSSLCACIAGVRVCWLFEWWC